jgi:hypothetical protein
MNALFSNIVMNLEAQIAYLMKEWIALLVHRHWSHMSCKPDIVI